MASPPQWLSPSVVTGMCDSGAVSKVTLDELGLRIPPRPRIPLCPCIPQSPALRSLPLSVVGAWSLQGWGWGGYQAQGGGIGKWRGTGHPSPPRSQQSHPLGMGVYDLFQRQDLKDLGDQVRVFPSSLLEHLPGRKPEIESVVPHPALGKRPRPWVGVHPESHRIPWMKSLPKHLLSGWDGLNGQCSGCRGPNPGRWGVG